MDLYVSNLPPMIISDDLYNLFKEYGEVSYVILSKEKGFAIVKMLHREDLEKACSILNGKELGGKRLSVRESKVKGLKVKTNLPEA